MKKCLLLGILLTQAACSIAPTQNYHSASSLGSGKNELKLTAMAPGVSYDRGLSQNLDFGVGVEVQAGPLYHARLKYALINKKSGFSFALLGGGGISDDLGNAKSAYAGSIMSYRASSVEVFAGYRLNHVDWNNDLSREDRDDILDFIPNKYNFTYNQVDVGLTFYGQSHFLTLGARAFFMDGDEDISPVIDLGFHF